jgi:hypothetical protein
MNDTIRELSLDEYATLRSQIEGDLPPVSNDEATTLLGRRIWKLALKGKNRDYIAQKLQVALPILDQALNAYSLRLGASVDHYRLLDNERLEKLIGYWLPIATGGPVNIQKIRNGEAFWESDFDRPLHASHFIVQAIQQRLKLMSATGGISELIKGIPGTGDPDRPYSERQIIIWLKEVLPSIERITRELELPHANGSELPATNGESTKGNQNQTGAPGEEGWFNGGSDNAHS